MVFLLTDPNSPVARFVQGIVPNDHRSLTIGTIAGRATVGSLRQKPWCHVAFTPSFILVIVEAKPIASALEDKSLWYAHEFSHPSAYILELDVRMRQELIQAVHLSEAAHIDPTAITPQTFRLPHMQKLMHEVLEVLERGRGFVVLRGIPVKDLTEQGTLHVIAGLSRQLGELVSLNIHRTKIETITNHQQPLNE